MRRQIDSVQSELNQQIDTVQSELKKVHQEIKTETSKVQQNEKKPGKSSEDIDCKALLQELMGLMWHEVGSARQAATDEVARGKAMHSENASLKVRVDKLEESLRLLQEKLVAAEREREVMRQRLELASTDMDSHMKAEKQRLEGLIVQVSADQLDSRVPHCTSPYTPPSHATGTRTCSTVEIKRGGVESQPGGAQAGCSAARAQADSFNVLAAGRTDWTSHTSEGAAGQLARRSLCTTTPCLDAHAHTGTQSERRCPDRCAHDVTSAPDAQVRDLVNLIALRENQMSTGGSWTDQSGPGWFEGQVNVGAGRMHSKDFASRQPRSQGAMLVGEPALHEHGTGIRYARSPAPRPQSSAFSLEGSSLSRGLSRGVIPGPLASPRVWSPRSLDTRPIIGQNGDLSTQLMIVPSSIRQSAAGSLAARSPTVRPATAGSLTARSPVRPATAGSLTARAPTSRPVSLPLTARSPRPATAA